MNKKKHDRNVCTDGIVKSTSRIVKKKNYDEIILEFHLFFCFCLRMFMFKKKKLKLGWDVTTKPSYVLNLFFFI